MANNALRRVRRSVGLSQVDLARLAGVAQTAISAYERGETMPSRVVLLRIMGALGVDCPTRIGYRWRTELGVEAHV